MGKQYRDEIAMVCHDIMKDAQSVGGFSEAEMKEFETNCFIEGPEKSGKIIQYPDLPSASL